jgi:hypothetical protein
VTAHSDKESAAPTFKRGYGFHPLCAFVDHGPTGTGEVLAIALRAGNAGSNITVDLIPAPAWTPAYDADGGVRDGAWVAEATGLLDLSRWPLGMRVIVRNECAHPGAQLRLTDRDGLRITAFTTNSRRGQLPDLELRHRRRARTTDRIRAAKHTGFAQPAAARLRPKPDLVRHRATGTVTSHGLRVAGGRRGGTSQEAALKTYCGAT